MVDSGAGRSDDCSDVLLLLLGGQVRASSRSKTLANSWLATPDGWLQDPLRRFYRFEGRVLLFICDFDFCSLINLMH